MACLACVVALCLLPGLLRLESDNSPRVFYVLASDAVQSYDALCAQFGNDEAVRLSLQGEKLWTPDGLQWLRQLETDVAAVAGVASAVGPLSRRPTASPADDSPDAVRRRLQARPLDGQLGLISTDGAMLTVWVQLATADPVSRRQTLDELQLLLATAPPGLEASMVGLPVLNMALDRSSQEIGQVFFPALMAFTVVLLGCVFRHWRGVVVPLGFVGLCLLSTMGAMGYSGVRLNLVLAMLPPLLFVIALATALHLLLYFRRLHLARPNETPPELALATFADKGWAVWWAGLTTFIGFASLALSPVAPVRSLGLWAAVGLAVLTCLAFGLYPLMLAGGAPRRSTSSRLEQWTQEVARRWGRRLPSYRGWTLAVAAALMALAVAGLPRLGVESNALRYLPSDHPVRQGIETLERHGIGSATVDILITDPNQDFNAAATLAPLQEAAERLLREPHVLGAVSAETVLQDALATTPPWPMMGAAQRRQGVWQLLREHETGGRALAALVNDASHTARLSLFVETVDDRQLTPIIDAASKTVEEAFPSAVVTVTGQYPLLMEAQRHLLSTLGVSLCITFFAVSCLFMLLLPGVRLPLLALVPNIWPVLGVLGFMGWLAIPLDIATVMVASVVLGLAVDDTLHTLGHFRRLAPTLGSRAAVAKTLEITAPAYVLTGLLLMIGFGVCALSSFAPTARFGGLSALAIGLAVLGDLFLLPSLLCGLPEDLCDANAKEPRETS